MKKTALFLAAMLTWVCCQAQDGTPDRGYIVKVGDMAPDFQIEYLDGTTQMLSELRGRVVMIQFTASWCGVCRTEMPHIEKDIWQKHGANPGFALIGIDYGEKKDVTAAFAQRMQITYPLTLDTAGEKFHLFAAPRAGVTRNVVIDREGRIAFLTRLFNNEEFTAMKEAIDGLLAQ